MEDEEDAASLRKFEWMELKADASLPAYVKNTTSYSSAIVAGQYVYVVGNMGREMGQSCASGVCRIDCVKSKWEWFNTAGPRPTGHVNCLFQDAIYIYSGNDANKLMRNEVWKLDLITMEWAQMRHAGTRPQRRSFAAGGLFQRSECMVVFGGEVYGPKEVKFLSNQVWLFDLRKLKWHAPRIRGRRPCPRFTHDSVAVGDVLYVFGGCGDKEVLGDLHILIQAKNGSLAWSQPKVAGDKPKPVYNHSITFHAGRWIVDGASGFMVFNALHVRSWLDHDIGNFSCQGGTETTACEA